jgi:hypothetical protein
MISYSRSPKLLLVICGFILLPVSSPASQVLWTVSGVSFNDGSTAAGSFVFDADLDEFSNIDVTTTQGTVRSQGMFFPAENYLFLNDSGCCNIGSTGVLLLTSDAADQTGLPSLSLAFSTPLTDSGGAVTLALADSFEGHCDTATCGIIGSPSEEVTAGSIIGTPVAPEPCSTLLLGCGLGILFLLGHRNCQEASLQRGLTNQGNS